MLIAGETVDTDLSDLPVFLQVYSEPIRAAIASLRFVRDQDVDDVFQSFIFKVQQKDLLGDYREKKNAGQVERFRGWLFRSLRNHAVDYYRRQSGKPGQREPLELIDTADSRSGVDREATEDDLLYALFVLHLAVQHVRRHWQDNAKLEVWASFEEIYLRGLIPRRGPAPDSGVAGRPAKRDAARRPTQRMYNQAVSVLRVLRRVLPEIIPADLCDRPTPEERYQEWCSILVRSRAVRDLPIWLAFLQAPSLSPDAPAGNSENIAVTPVMLEGEDPVDARDRPDVARAEAEAAIRVKVEAEAEHERSEAEYDELQVLLSFWLAMPFRDYITMPPGITPGGTTSALSLRNLIVDRAGPSSTAELVALLRQVKNFAKQMHQFVTEGLDPRSGPEAPRRTHSMPAEVAQVLYNLAVALALARCDEQIASLPPETIQKNFVWLATQKWLTRELAPVFNEALHRFAPSAPVLS